MEDTVPFGSQEFWILSTVLLVSRGMDFLSTYVATPNMVLEANPIARKMGWKWGVLFNLALVAGFARWPLAAIIISTTSLLVAARNFQGAWMMRIMGEYEYSSHVVDKILRTPLPLYLLCLLGQTGLVAAVGGTLMYFSELYLVPFGIGIGLVSYAFAVGFYSLLSLWRIRRNSRYTGPQLDENIWPPRPGE